MRVKIQGHQVTCGVVIGKEASTLRIPIIGRHGNVLRNSRGVWKRWEHDRKGRIG